MIRKQIYITKEQEKYLKDTSKKKGIKEAELIRRALDEYISREND